MTEAAKLFRIAHTANARHAANLAKLQFMSMTKANRYAFETYGDQLQVMADEAATANARFAEAVKGLPADEIADIVAVALAA